MFVRSPSVRLWSVRLAAILVASLATAGAGHAECLYKPFAFFPERNDGVIVGAVVDPGGACNHRFKEGPGYKFTSVTPDSKPLHGKLEQRDDGVFDYKPAPGFTGADLYSFKICAIKGKKSGCSLVAFDVKVEEPPERAPGASARPAAAASGADDCWSMAPDKASAACTRIIDAPDGSAADRLRALKARGRALFRSGNLDGAFADFSAVLDRDSKDYQSWNNRGMVQQRRGKLDAAIADYDRSIAAAPDQPAAWTNRANAARLKGDLARAVADSTQAIRIAPKFAGGYKVRGQTLIQQNEVSRAVADLARAIELAPDDLDSRLIRGDAFRKSGDDAKALADYDAVIARAPDYPLSYIGRGALYLSRSDFSRAIADLDRALTAYPKNAAAANYRGVAAMQTGDFSRAIVDLTAAFAAAPDKVGVLANRGFAHFGAGDFVAAAADFQKLAEGDPANAYAQLWRRMARARAGETDLGAQPAAIDPAAWPAPVVAFFAQTISRDEMLAAALKAGDDRTRATQTCEAYFYAGERALIDGQASEADRLIRQATKLCTLPIQERAGALAESMRMAH